MTSRPINYAAWAITAFIFYAVFKNTSIDLTVQKLFFNQSLNSFTLQHNPLIEKYLYHGLKVAAYTGGLASIAWLIYMIRTNSDSRTNEPYIAALIATICIPLVITLLKRLTNIDCPWSFHEFGGQLSYINSMDFFTEKALKGQCFPAGHATGGFIWLSWAMIFHRHSSMLAKKMLVIGLSLGLVMGISRMAQGAHFLSHTISTVMVIWLTTLISITIAHRITK